MVSRSSCSWLANRWWAWKRSRRHQTASAEQWLSPDHARHRLAIRLGRLWHRAVMGTPYYRQRLANPPARHADFWDSWSRLPLLSKEDLRTRKHELTHPRLRNARDVYENATGGSTGAPVHFLQNRAYQEHVRALKQLRDEWSGRRSGDTRVRLWGCEADIYGPNGDRSRRVVRRGLHEFICNAHQMGPDHIREYLELIGDIQPVALMGYAESLDALAAYVLENGPPAHQPRVIQSEGGMLLPEMRERISRAFGAPVFDRYGSREFGVIASECPEHDGMHVFLPHVHVEALRPDGTLCDDGELGEIVVTCLSNAVMPLIRYRIGDLGRLTWKPCGCGRGWPRLLAVEGRTRDYFKLADGSRVLVPGSIFFKHPWIKKFRLVQEAPDGFCALLAVDQADRPEEISSLVADLSAVLGLSCTIRVEWCDKIPTLPSGKHQAFQALEN